MDRLYDRRRAYNSAEIALIAQRREADAKASHEQRGGRMTYSKGNGK